MFENSKSWMMAEINKIVIYQDPAPIPGSSLVDFVKAFIEDIKKMTKRL